MKPKLIWMGISSIILMVGLVLIFFGLRDINQARASVGWRPVDGVIVSSDLGVEDDGEGNTLYRADITYTYSLDGQDYRGERVFFGAMSTSERKQVFDMLLKYPQGTPVTVFYNPEDPTQAVLEPGIHGANWFLPALGAGFVVFGLVFLGIGLLISF